MCFTLIIASIDKEGTLYKPLKSQCASSQKDGFFFYRLTKQCWFLLGFQTSQKQELRALKVLGGQEQIMHNFMGK